MTALQLLTSVQLNFLQSHPTIDHHVGQVTSGGNDSQDDEAGRGNQATNCISPDFGSATHDAQLPSKLITNCTATVLAVKVKHLSILPLKSIYTFIVICRREPKRYYYFHLTLNSSCKFRSLQCLADSRHPPANIAGILERLLAMLRPSCSENLTIYRDIEKHISLITSQTIALVPRTL